MYNITVICTIHSEVGKCNVNELYKLIEMVQPDVIFEELSTMAYKRCYVIQNLFTLESGAIKKYLQKHRIIHLPVVGSEIVNEMEEKLNHLIRYAGYTQLIDNLISLEENYGFQFLNSKESIQLFERIKAFENVILNQSNNDTKLLFEKVDKIVDKYENEIIRNVYFYSKRHHYNQAILFIGAAHKKSIMQKVEEFNTNEDLKLNWSFYNT